MKKPLVSVIIPTYSRPTKLKDAIESVLNQTYKQLEIVVVDDNSPNTVGRNETANLISQFDDPRILYICHDINRGANAARNTGIKESSGEYIAFLDDDDRYVSAKIEEQINAITCTTLNFDQGIFIFTGAIRLGDPIYPVSKWMNVSDDKLFYPEQNLIFSKNYIGSNSYIMVDRQSLIAVGAFDYSLPSCQDWDLFIRLAIKGVKFVGVNMPLVEYYSHEEERITNDKTKKVQGHLTVLNKYEAIIAEREPSCLTSFYRYLYYQILTDNRAESKMILFKIKSTSENFRGYLKFWSDYVLFYISRFPRVVVFLRIIKNKLVKEV
ncbi:MAG: glycosyltransferase [Bacteroidales bacterium]|jgi:glycosyltransferase involved in cell wall biosynthesis|nr:glycosyltransferase [Bacteroidales bacterium]